MIMSFMNINKQCGCIKVYESNYKLQVLVKILMNIIEQVHSFWASGASA